MKTLISGHRKHKLYNYDLEWVEGSISDIVTSNPSIIGMSGMADGIDLLFCMILLENNMGYHCYIPFEEQDEYMSDLDKNVRNRFISKAWLVKKAKNSQMVEECDTGIIVWDGNKGGTHNVFQQMIEAKKSFWWIEPSNKKVIQF